jgi:poly(hydroxyalkanoate) depolymerase family esterase
MWADTTEESMRPRPRRLCLAVTALAIGLVGCASAAPPCQPESATTGAVTGLPGGTTAGASQGGLTPVMGFGSNPGQLNLYVHVPDDLPDHPAMVIALHGCTQGAADYAAAGWNQLADQWKFVMAYAETTGATGNQLRCFQFFDPAHNRRDMGESASIKQMVDYVSAQYSVDPQRTFVAGFSAGGGMAAALLANYPDVFRGGTIMSGLPYGCATSSNDAFTCLSTPSMDSEDMLAAKATAAMNGYAGPFPRVSIFQGSGDYIVSPSKLTELVKQWSGVHGIDASQPGSTEMVGKATHNQYLDGSGKAQVESYLVDGMGHGVPIQAGFAPAGGCGMAGAYVLEEGLCSVYLAGQFLGLDPGGPTMPGGNPGGPGQPGQPGGADGGVPAGGGADGGSWTPPTGSSPSGGNGGSTPGGSGTGTGNGNGTGTVSPGGAFPSITPCQA